MAVKDVLATFPAVAIEILKTEGKLVGPSDKLDRPSDQVDHDRSGKTIMTNIVAAVITTTRDSAPSNVVSCDSKPGILRP